MLLSFCLLLILVYLVILVLIVKLCMNEMRKWEMLPMQLDEIKYFLNLIWFQLMFILCQEDKYTHTLSVKDNNPGFVMN